MDYHRGSLTPLPGQELTMAAMQHQQQQVQQPIYPGVRIGGSEIAGAFTIQVLHPNGQTISVEIGDLTRPMSAASSHGTYIAPGSSGPVRERLARPSSDMMRHRSSSVASTSGMEYENRGGGAGAGSSSRSRPSSRLADRIGAMNINGGGGPPHQHQSQRYHSNNHSSMPDLTRSDPESYANDGGNQYDNNGSGGSNGHHNSSFGRDGFTRPHSRMSNRSFVNHHEPYARPFSSQSHRSNGSSFQSNGFRPRQKDGFYPRYEHGSKTNVGSYPILPPERRRPFFTPVPEDPVAAVLVKNISSECSLSDINSTFIDFGRVKCVELIERAGPIMTAYIEYLKKDDADMAIQNTNGVVADQFLLETMHVNGHIVHRPHKTSSDPALRLTVENGLVCEKARPAAATGQTDGNRTPTAQTSAMFSSKSPTPLPAPVVSGDTSNRNSANNIYATTVERSTSEDLWGATSSVTAANTSTATTGSGWDMPESKISATTTDNDGWGMPTALPPKEENTNGWREQSVREVSSDIDLT